MRTSFLLLGLDQVLDPRCTRHLTLRRCFRLRPPGKRSHHFIIHTNHQEHVLPSIQTAPAQSEPRNDAQAVARHLVPGGFISAVPHTSHPVVVVVVVVREPAAKRHPEKAARGDDPECRLSRRVFLHYLCLIFFYS